jgi:hypothetical protein
VTASSGTVLANLAYLIGAVVFAILGGFVVWWRHRQPKSVDANVASFQRGLSALAPESGLGSDHHQGVTPRRGGHVHLRHATTTGEAAAEHAGGDSG